MNTDQSLVRAHLTTLIVAAYVTHNSVPTTELPDLITSVHGTLVGLDQPAVAAPLMPAVPIKKSVEPNHVVCLECGEKFRSLRRHVGRHALDATAYRARWGLPSSHPIVAPNYSDVRRSIAKGMGLGSPPKLSASMQARVQPSPRRGTSEPAQASA